MLTWGAGRGSEEAGGSSAHLTVAYSVSESFGPSDMHCDFLTELTKLTLTSPTVSVGANLPQVCRCKVPFMQPDRGKSRESTYQKLATSIGTQTPGPLAWAVFPKLTYLRSLLRLLTGIHVSKYMAPKRCSNPCESSREHCFVRLVLSEAEEAC